MSVAARALETAVALPPRVVELQHGLDWEGFLPGRARGAAWRTQVVIKRGIDIVLGSVFLVLALPIIVVAGLLIVATSRGPVIYRYPVLGHRARPFVGYKLRTMVADAESRKESYAAQNEMRGPVFKLRSDPRVTPVGRWLRRLSIDELPQLWSVVKGDLSLVGPRAPGPDEFTRFEPWQCGKLAVKPGITCIWQVSGRSEIADFDTWVRMDLDYIERWSLWLDLRILLRTVPAVLSMRGAY